MSYGAFASFYDKLMGNVDYPGISRWIDTAVKRYRPGSVSVVDLACGTGTLSLLLSDMGYDLICVDGSEEMLMQARQKLPQALILRQSMQKLDLYGTNDVIVCTLDSLNHLPRKEDAAAVFKRAALFLENGGLLIFDVNTLRKHHETLANNCFVYENEDVFCVWQNFLEGDRVTIALDFFSKESRLYRRESEKFSETAFSCDYLTEALEAADFEVLGVFGGYTDNPLTENDDRAVFIARRNDRS